MKYLILLFLIISLQADVKDCNYYDVQSKVYLEKSKYTKTKVSSYRFQQIAKKYHIQYKECMHYNKINTFMKYKGYR